MAVAQFARSPAGFPPTTHLKLTSFLLALGCLSCGPDPEGHSRLRIAAASDLQFALPAVTEAWGRDHQVNVETVFGSSGQLAAQLAAGAPFDLFLAADQTYVDHLASTGVIEPDSVKPYALGRLVLVVAPDLAAVVRTMNDLSKPEVKVIALANPEHAPFGKIAKQALERAGVWQVIGSKHVLADSVRQALQMVESGNADVALVSRSLTARGLRGQVIELDDSLHDPLIQALGVVRNSPHAEQAKQFATFLVSEKGRKTLVEAGLDPAGGPPTRPAPP